MNIIAERAGTPATKARSRVDRPQEVVNDTSRRRRFCSDKCRLRAWAAQDLAGAVEAGEADGLRDIIERLKA